MTDLQELHDLVASDPLPSSRPDIGSLIRHGRRLQHRRSAAYGAAGVAAVVTVAGALGATHALGSGQGREPQDGFAGTSSHPRPHHSSHPRSVTPPADLCEVTGAIFLCEQPPRESHIPVGDVVQIGHRTDDGHPEVLYAVQQRGTDLRTGTPASIVSVHAGFQSADGLHGVAIDLQPGSGPDLPILMTGGTQAGRYAIAGTVKNGTYDTITWTDADGGTHPVTGLSTTMVPGWTVFWLYGSDDQGPAYDFDKVVVHAGATSCALSECAVQGGF
jgi:hypothetical protein